MNNTHDLLIESDILPLFDYTLNADSKSVLADILRKPLPTIADIKFRQSIIQQIINCKPLWNEYVYNKIDYTDTYKFLSYFSIDDLKPREYLIYWFKKQKRNILEGEYIQLIQYLSKLEKIIKDNIDIKAFPKKYQEDLWFIINFITSFKPKHYKSKINKDKFGYKSVQQLNRIVSDKRKTGDTITFFEKLNLLEAYISIAKAISKNKYQFIVLNEERIFKLSEFYHPLLVNPVKNSIDLVDNIALITGANMSGKSTLLKSLGLCVYLSHVGLAVPAAEGSIPFYDSIAIQINHSDDLKNGYSHFMNEIIKLKDVVQQASEGKRCFAVFDELFKGTNYEDALAISVKTVLGLGKFDTSTFFISTHIAELKNKLEIHHVNCSPYYIDCEIELDTPTFSYVLKKGWSNLKIGQLLFRKEGLNELLSS